MKSSSLEILEEANLPPEQARAILKVMESESADHPFSTRSDVAAAVAELKAEMRAMEARLSQRFNSQLVAMTGIFAALVTIYTGAVGVMLHFGAGR